MDIASRADLPGLGRRARRSPSPDQTAPITLTSVPPITASLATAANPTTGAAKAILLTLGIGVVGAIGIAGRKRAIPDEPA